MADLVNEAEIAELRNQVAKIDNKSIMDTEIDEIKNLEDDLNLHSLKKILMKLN